MGRHLKPQKVKDVEDRQTGTWYPVYLDRNRLVFYAEPAVDVRVEAETAEECVRLLRQKFGELRTYDWKPYLVIDGPEIEEARGHGWSHRSEWITGGVELKFRRTERSPSPSGEPGKFVERKHFEDLDDEIRAPKNKHDRENRKRWEEGKETERVWGSPSDIYLPYTPDLWARMLRLKDVLDRASSDLETLLRLGQENKEALVARLGGSLPLLLSAGPPEPPTRSERKARRR